MKHMKELTDDALDLLAKNGIFLTVNQVEIFYHACDCYAWNNVPAKILGFYHKLEFCPDDIRLFFIFHELAHFSSLKHCKTFYKTLKKYLKLAGFKNTNGRYHLGRINSEYLQYYGEHVVFLDVLV